MTLREEIRNCIDDAWRSHDGTWGQFKDKAADQILDLIRKEIEGMENPYLDFSHSVDDRWVKDNTFKVTIETVLKELEVKDEAKGTER